MGIREDRMAMKPVEELSRQEAIQELERRAHATLGPKVRLKAVFYRNLSWEAELEGPDLPEGTHGYLYDDPTGDVQFGTRIEPGTGH
ncbi:MAG TPA: hypothetical protein V6D00_16065 [Pantanalinema sp.]